MEKQAYEELKRLISEGDMKTVFEKLSALSLRAHLSNQVIALTGEWNRLQEKIRLNTISNEDSTVETNRIRKGTLDLVEECRTAYAPEPAVEKKTKRRRGLPAVIVGVMLLSVVAVYFWKTLGKSDSYFQVAAEGIPREILNELGRLQRNAQNVKGVAVAPEFSGWVILYGRNQTRYKDIPQALVVKLEEFAQSDEDIKQVLLGKHSRWLVLRRYNDYWHSGDFPSELIVMLDTFYNRQEEIKQVAVGLDMEWAVLRNQRDFWGDRLPEDLLAKLWEIYREGKDEIKCISLGAEGRWIVLVNKNEYFASPGTPRSLQRQLEALQRKDATLIQVIMAGDEAWLLLFRD